MDIYELNPLGILNLKPTNDSIEVFLLKLQKTWNNITLLIQMMALKSPNHVITMRITRAIAKDDTAHPLFRCYTSAVIFKELSRKIGVHQLGNSIIVRQYTLGGQGFPDHTFILIVYNSRTYILQSYYHAYTVGGRYGFYRMSKEIERRFFDLMYQYEKIALNPANQPNLHMLNYLNKELEIFTGVDSSRHKSDIMPNPGNPIFTYEDVISFTPSTFINKMTSRIYYELCLLYRYVPHTEEVRYSTEYTLFNCGHGEKSFTSQFIGMPVPNEAYGASYYNFPIHESVNIRNAIWYVFNELDIKPINNQYCSEPYISPHKKSRRRKSIRSR